jgi:hypothetical protein
MPDSPTAQKSALDASACLRSYLTLGTMWAVVALGGFFVAMKPPHNWEFVYIPGGVGIGFMLWLRAFRLKIADGELSYRTLFFGNRSIGLADIEKAETQVIGTSKGEYRVLLIYPRAGNLQKPIRVNIKVFSKEDLGRLFDLLGPKFKSSRRIGVYTDESA